MILNPQSNSQIHAWADLELPPLVESVQKFSMNTVISFFLATEVIYVPPFMVIMSNPYGETY